MANRSTPALAAGPACIVVLTAALCTGVVPFVTYAESPAAHVALPPADTVPGYVALLLVNETPFPGEKGWVSEADTKAAMLAILWVLESRLHHVPEGYRQEQLASVRCDDIIDVITAGGECASASPISSNAPIRASRVDLPGC